MENLQSVKRVVAEHPRGYVIETQANLDSGMANGNVGVILGFQNPKPLSDTINFLEAFADMGLRCCGLAFRENSYYGSGFSSAIDSGLSQIGQRAVMTMNSRGIIIDLSHVGDRTAMEAVELSEHPAIFSHSMARTLISKGPRVQWAGVTNNFVKRAAPDELIVAAANKGGVICPDARLGGSIENWIEHIQYLTKLVGTDHVGLTAQDDWHRSQKDVNRIQTYLPGYDSLVGNKKRILGDDYRIHRMEDQLGPKVLERSRLIAMLERLYSPEDIEKITGGNMIRVLKTVLPK